MLLKLHDMGDMRIHKEFNHFWRIVQKNKVLRLRVDAEYPPYWARYWSRWPRGEKLIRLLGILFRSIKVCHVIQTLYRRICRKRWYVRLLVSDIRNYSSPHIVFVCIFCWILISRSPVISNYQDSNQENLNDRAMTLQITPSSVFQNRQFTRLVFNATKIKLYLILFFLFIMLLPPFITGILLSE